jgi:hypothetical protein
MMRPLRVWLIWIATVCLAVGCSGNTPTQPGGGVELSPAPLAGVWRGLFEVTHCVGIGAGCSGGHLSEFQLTLVPSGNGLAGVLVLLDSERTTVDVTATPSPGGLQFSARGFDADRSGSWPVRTVVSALDLRADAAHGLAGTMTYTNTTSRTFSRTIVFRSAVAQVSSAQPGLFHGTWLGAYRTVSCSGDCREGSSYSNPAGGSVTLTLSQVGSEVVGVVMSHLVHGTAQSAALTASADGLTAEACPVCWDCAGVCQTAVRDVRVSIDKLGRLTGTFEYGIKGWTGRDHFRQTMRVELVGVTRRW